MQAGTAHLKMRHPQTVDEALHDLSSAGEAGTAVAGATWVMRAPLRHEQKAERFVSLGRVAGFNRLDVETESIAIGPLATHDLLLRRLPETFNFRGLRAAAGCAANPGIRRIATIGGNICAWDFAASDFAPVLLSLDAMIEIASGDGSQALTAEEFLIRRTNLGRPWLVTGITLRRNARRVSAHERLPMRRAGDYPCAIVSVSFQVDGAGAVRNPLIGVGAVEARARRWRGLEAAVTGYPPDAVRAEEAARDLIGEFNGREAADAPGWYRLSVLPVLVRRAFASIAAGPAERTR